MWLGKLKSAPESRMAGGMSAAQLAEMRQAERCAEELHATRLARRKYGRHRIEERLPLFRDDDGGRFRARTIRTLCPRDRWKTVVETAVTHAFEPIGQRRNIERTQTACGIVCEGRDRAGDDVRSWITCPDCLRLMTAWEVGRHEQ